MSNRILKVALCATLIAGMASASLAQGAGDAIAKRQGAMKTLFPTANAVKAAAAAGDFDGAAAKAKELAGTVHGFGTLFPAGSGPSDTAKTRAKPEIWTDAAGFKAALDKSAAAADAVTASVASKDAAKINDAVTAFQGTCGGCHTPFRGPPVA
jgi:cytochrome c556